MLEDELPARGETSLPAVPCGRVIYVVAGSVEVAPDGAVAADDAVDHEPTSAWFCAASCDVKAGETAARLWRWELIASPPDDGRMYGPDVRSTSKQARLVDLDRGEYMMRCDRVDFPLAGIAHTHTHPGPGIRCLLTGAIRILVAGAETDYLPGEPWFESGPDPVLAQTSASEATSFVRGMILPRALQGRSSIQYVDPGDADKPKTQQYTRFVDAFIDV